MYSLARIYTVCFFGFHQSHYPSWNKSYRGTVSKLKNLISVAFTAGYTETEPVESKLNTLYNIFFSEISPSTRQGCVYIHAMKELKYKISLRYFFSRNNFLQCVVYMLIMSSQSHPHCTMQTITTATLLAYQTPSTARSPLAGYIMCLASHSSSYVAFGLLIEGIYKIYYLFPVPTTSTVNEESEEEVQFKNNWG